MQLSEDVDNFVGIYNLQTDSLIKGHLYWKKVEEINQEIVTEYIYFSITNVGEFWYITKVEGKNPEAESLVYWMFWYGLYLYNL